MDEKFRFLLLADGGEGVERDVDEEADAMVVQHDVGRRLFSDFSSDEGVHFGAFLETAKVRKKRKGKPILLKS